MKTIVLIIISTLALCCPVGRTICRPGPDNMPPHTPAGSTGKYLAVNKGINFLADFSGGNVIAASGFGFTTPEFGHIPYCQARIDTTIITNNYPDPYWILRMPFIQGANSDNFLILEQPLTGQILSSGNSMRFVIMFAPKPGDYGEKSAELVVKMNYLEDSVIKVPLNCFVDKLDIGFTPSALDFGVDFTKASFYKQIKLKNNSLLSYHLREIITDNPDITVTPGSGTFAGLEEKSFDVQWYALQEGTINSRLTFVFDEPCPDEKVVLNVTGQAVVGPLTVTRELDLGLVPFCEEAADSVILSYTGNETIDIKDMTISGPDASLFHFDDNVALPQSITGNFRLARKIIFNAAQASADGPKSALVITKINIAGTEKELSSRLTASNVTASVIPSVINLKFQECVPGAVDNRKFTLKNTSVLPVNIDTIKAKNHPDSYTITPNGNIVLSPQKEMEFSVDFHPLSDGDYTDIISINSRINSCSIGRDISLEAVCRLVSGGFEVTACLPDTTAMIGDRDFGVPLYIKMNRDTVLNDLSFTATIRFSATTFQPVTSSQAGITGSIIHSGDRIVRIEGSKPRVTSTDSVLATIIGEVYLADKDFTDLFIDDIRFVTSGFIPKKQDGILRIAGLCQKNLSKVRLMNLPELSIIPNPADDNTEIIITGGEPGHVIINIFNSTGDKVESWELVKDAWKADIDIDLRLYPPGVYEIVALIGSHKLTGRLVVN